MTREPIFKQTVFLPNPKLEGRSFVGVIKYLDKMQRRKSLFEGRVYLTYSSRLQFITVRSQDKSLKHHIHIQEQRKSTLGFLLILYSA